MRTVLLSFILLLFSVTLWAQQPASEFPFIKTDHTQTSWFQEIQSARPNVIRAEAAFNEYFREHPQESSLQKKLFRRWLETARLSLDASGHYLPWSENPGAGNGSVANQRSAQPSGTWRMLGPNYAAQTTCGTSSSLSGGFCDRVYINPKNTQNLLAGFSYGGLWVSTDQGASWDLKDADLSNGTNTYANRDYYYGDIEASLVDSTILFAATEAGLIKSTNFGVNWSVCPQLNRTANPTTRPYFLALSPFNSNLLVCTFGRQVFRSTDGGNTWVLAFDNSAGGGNHYYTSQYNNNSNFGIYNRTYNFFGLEADHNNANQFYLGVWNAANEACIYRSTDGGATFSLLVNLDVALSRNLPDNLLFQTIPVQPDRFYIYPQFASDTLYRFNDTGSLLSKTKITTTVEAADINWLDENTIYTGFYGASSIMKSINGGVSFSDRTSGYGGCPKYVHPDVRSIDVVGNVVLIGSDGGLALSTDSMFTVNTIGREISSIDLWGFSSSPKSDILSAGCDHGPTKIRRYDGNNGWYSRGGGDAGETSVNQSNDRWIYYNHGYGIFKTELDTNNNFVNTVGITPGVSLQRTEFHPWLYYVAYGVTGTEVKVSRDNFSSFTSFYNFGQTVNVFKIAQKDTTVMYVLLTNNTIRRSTDAGASWTTITPSSAASGGQTNIVDITLGDDPQEIWAAYGNTQNTAKVLKSSDGGNSWTNITTPNLPTTPVTQLVYQRGTQGGVYLAYAGQKGVWYRNDTMAQWQMLGSGIAMMGYLRNIYTVPAKGKFRMGSSRGGWEHDLYEESTRPVANFAVDNNVSNCPLTPVSFVQNCSHSSGPATYAWSFPGGNPSSSTLQNPKVTYANPGQYSVTLTVTDQFGNTASHSLNNFITVLNSICSADSLADRMLDLPVSATNRIPLSSLPITGNEFTISVWVKLNGLQNSFAQIVSTNAPNTRFGLGFAFMGYAANTNLIFTHSAVPYGMTSSINLDTTDWHHIALTYSPTVVKIYVDGNTPWVRTGTFSAVDFSQTGFWINNDIHNQGGNFHGQIEELCFYDRALTQEEIRERIHLVRIPQNEPNLKGYYQFNQYDANQSRMYEVIGGQTSTIAGTLVAVSPVPVSSGYFDRNANVGNGTTAFPNTGVNLSFPSGIAPNGEMVVSRLHGNPFGSPQNTTSLSRDYWVIRNWGTQVFDTLASLSFSDLDPLSAIQYQYPALSHQLFKRRSNDWGNTWGSSVAVPDSLSQSGNGTVYFGSSAGITTFSQFVLGSVICDETIDSASICSGDSLFAGGAYQYAAGSYFDSFHNLAGCDSIVETVLYVEAPISASISQNGNTLSVNATPGASYQWLDCNSGFAAISGETNLSFTPSGSGSYAVVTELNGCRDTSSCQSVVITGRSGISKANDIRLYPNPGKGEFFLDLGEKSPNGKIELLDVRGRKIGEFPWQNQAIIPLRIEQAPGIYFLVVSSDNQTRRLKLILE